MRSPRRRDELAERLRGHRAPPSDEFVSSVASRVRGGKSPPATSRPALAVVLTVAVVAVVGAMGGVGYGDSAARQVADEVRHAVSSPGAATVHRQVTPADSQYCHGGDCFRRRHNRGQTPG